MRNRSLMFTFALLAAASGTAQAQLQVESDNTAYGTTAAEFLLFAPTARGSALGNSFSALVTDVSALHFNPAGLSLMTDAQLQVSTTSYLAETRYNWVGIGLPFGGGSKAFGIQIGSFGYGDQPVYTVEDPTGSEGLSYSVNQTVIGLTYSQQFSDRFSAGFTGKFVNDKLGGVSGQAFAVDFGTSFHATVSGRPIRAAFTIANLGTSLSHSGNALDATVVREPPDDQNQVPQEPVSARLQTKGWSLPVTFRVAMSYDLFQTSMSRFSVMGEFSQPNNSEPTFGFAGEYDLRLGTSGFSIQPRLSYTYASDNNFDPAASTDPNYAGFQSSAGSGSDGFAAGAGLYFRRSARSMGFGVDYAYRSFGLLGSVNVISLGLTW